MGISPHTVDQRARQAIKKMRAKSRVDAAKILASYGIFDHVTPYQSLTYQSVTLEADSKADSHSQQEAGDDAKGELAIKTVIAPPSLSKCPTNGTMALKALAWVLMIMVAAFIAFGVIQTLLILVGRSLV